MENISLFLRLALILDNKARIGEIRNFTNKELQEAQADLTPENNLCFIANVKKTKNAQCCLFLSEERKIQLDKFVRWVTST